MTTPARVSSWCQPGQTQTAGTAIVVPIDPYVPSSGPLMYTYSGNIGRPTMNWMTQPYTKVSSAILINGSTAHTWAFLRPKNWTYLTEAATANDTTLVMYDNPGTYSTNLKYPVASGEITAQVSDNTPASGDYVALQLDDGTWHFSLVSSLSSLTLTIATATPNITGGGAAVGRILFFFGAAGDKDPCTGRIDPVILPAASTTTQFSVPDGFITSFRPGEPMILYNANATAASTVASLAGFYSKY